MSPKVLFGVIKVVSNSSDENSSLIFKRGLKTYLGKKKKGEQQKVLDRKAYIAIKHTYVYTKILLLIYTLAGVKSLIYIRLLINY